VYRSAVFIRVHIDATPDDKALFKNVLLGRATPAFFFFRGGQLLHSHAAASAAVLEQHLREYLSAREQPVQCVLQQQQQEQQQQPEQQQQGEGAGEVAVAAKLLQQQQQQQRAEEERGEVDAGQVLCSGFSMADLVYNIQD